MIGETEAKTLCQQLLARCSDPAEVLLSIDDSALTRFANNAIHQNVAERNATLTVRILIGKRKGVATTNRLDPASLDAVVEKARAYAAASTEDPDAVGLSEPSSYQPVQGYDTLTAEYSPAARAQAVGTVCRLAKEKSLNAFGAFSTITGELVIANSQGVFAYNAHTSADFQTVIMGDDSSGWAQNSAWKVDLIPVEQVGRQAIEKTERGRNPRKIDPGQFTVILDPYVTQDIITSLNFYGIGAQAVLEGRSWMNDRFGQILMHPSVSIWDDALDPHGMPMPFDFEGTPRQRVEIVTNGVVMGPVYDRYTAQKASKTTTGHALPPSFAGFGTLALNLFMAPGNLDVEDMIRSTERGLYITRFWYTRLVHPRDCVITGMTRDGTFMIEHGELAYPVKNLRFTQSYIQTLANLEAIGRETVLLYEDWGSMAVRVPALKSSQFNFTGSTV
jgi:predicted Zn-dependent protease